MVTSLNRVTQFLAALSRRTVVAMPSSGVPGCTACRSWVNMAEAWTKLGHYVQRNQCDALIDAYFTDDQ